MENMGYKMKKANTLFLVNMIKSNIGQKGNIVFYSLTNGVL